MRKTAMLVLAAGIAAQAQNPIIHDNYTADPTARVFGDRVYMYPSHDIPSPVDGLNDWFCMADYHAYSSADLIDWTDHGVIVSQETVPWVQGDSYTMWAPDCVERDGRYYFYFPAAPKGGRGFGVGVAVADDPAGPFTPQPEPIKGVMGIDPCVLIDDDGAAYIYWSGMGIRCARLTDDMLALVGESRQMEGLPDGFKEGPFAFKRDGRYYLTFPWVRENTETLAYCMADNPMGPWEFKGLIMAESPTGCWTNHHSLVEYKGDWYLFYHHNDYSPDMDKRRSARIDRVTFNPDGTINQVQPTLRGVGVADGRKPVHIDRYTAASAGAGTRFVDDNRRFDGFSVLLPAKGEYATFDDVDLGTAAPAKVSARVRADKGGKLRVDCGGATATLTVPATAAWTVAEAPVSGTATGINTLRATVEEGDAEIDYVVYDSPLAPTNPAGVDGGYFTKAAPGEGPCCDSEGFIRHWWLLDPIDKPNRTNTVFTDSYLQRELTKEYFPGQMTIVPKKDGQTVKVDGKKLAWHDLVSDGYNVHLYRFASKGGKQVYGVLFWAVTVIDCAEDYTDVRLSAGSNSASIWWLDGEQVLMMSGDRRMVQDDCASRRLTLEKGRHVLRCAVINGPGMSSFCARFIDADGKPIIF